MTKQPSKDEDSNFYETLTPSMAYPMGIEGNTSNITPLWVYPAWIIGSIILGVLIGLAISDLERPVAVIVPAGEVTTFAQSSDAVTQTALALSKTETQSPQGTAASVQGSPESLQPTQSASAFQPVNSAYGQQGSVGVPAAMR